MFGSIVAVILLINMIITKDSGYAIAAGLFELAGVVYTVLPRPKRFKTKEVNSNEVPGK